jgi:xyloglucan-specific exo-beta-1,4-glucanase
VADKRALLALNSPLRRANPGARVRCRRRIARCSPVELLESRLLLSTNPDSFQNATIEGGGFVDGVFFSPSQQNVIYARTDIGGLYKTTDDGTSWKQLLDFVGSGTTTSGNGTQSQLIGVLSFAIDPENPNNLYADVGQYSGTNGAVFYSTNAGQTWSQTNLSFYVGGNSNGRATGERIAVDPYDSNIVLLGSNANGLWESTNAGHSFSQVSSFSTTASITFVEFKPYGGTVGKPTQNIIVGVDSTAGLSPQVAGNAPTNLYQSANGGTSWSEIGGTTMGLGKNVLPISVTALTSSGTTATVTTSAATGFAAGDRVTIAGATPSTYDGTFTITAIESSATFTYDIASATSAATGSITATANYSLIPNHAVWASNGYIYLTYSDGLAPGGTQDVGGVFQYNTSTGAWANISPQIPGAGTNASFGYLGLALDPENNTTIAVTTINDYSGIDKIYRTTNSTGTAPTWVVLYDTDSAQNHGYGGYDTTRNTSNAPWVAGFGDGIGNWAATVAINPFNSAQLMYGDGQGLWATNQATSTVQLSGANSWYFPDYGIEFTAVNDLIAPASGVPLFSGMGDINGFVHTTLTSSPAAGAISNGYGPLDFDQANSNDVVDLGAGTNGGIYSTNDGTSWTAFGSQAGSGGGTIAVSSVAAPGVPVLVWVPSEGLPYYSTNLGSTWIAATMPSGTLSGGNIISDRIQAGTFYYTTENSSGNQLSTYESTNGGTSFTLKSQSSIGFTRITANPFVAGDLWLANSKGLYHSTNFGASWVNSNSNIQAAYSVALGAPAPGRTNAAVYLWGEIGGIVGLFRSDDSGLTWVRINDTADQWGGRIGPLAADPNVFGRVYIGVNGRGIIIGDPVNMLPTGWSDADINTPGNPGFAADSTTLSNGTVVNQWTINGGGAGIVGGGDQFNFASDTETGDASVVAQITGLDNAGSGIPQAGVMFRAGNSAAGDAFAAIVQNTAGQLIFEYRTTSGGSIATTTLGGMPIGSEHVALVRSGSNYSAYYGIDGTHWTQLALQRHFRSTALVFDE